MRGFEGDVPPGVDSRGRSREPTILRTRQSDGRDENTSDEFIQAYPEASWAIKDRHYMDDYLDSMDTIEEAIIRAQQVTHIHRKGGFEIRNWM